MSDTTNRIVSLIGMPGVGKSTVGVLLAKSLGLAFLDTDLEIQLREHATLQEIIEDKGYRYLREIEEQVLLEVSLHNSVIATGGSAVYSSRAMSRLQEAGSLIYLRADLPTLEQRVAGALDRGIASDPLQSFSAIYTERTPLYEEAADYAVDASIGNVQSVAQKIQALLPSRQ